MIKKNYLIQAHQNPEQLYRLINKLKDRDSFFYIHIDLKSCIDDFSDLIIGDNIFFIKERVDCIWGDFSQVKATLNMCKNVLNDGYDMRSRIILMSGQDYIIKSKLYIDEFLAKNLETNFINIEKIDANRIHHLRNLKAYKINHSSKKFDYTLVSKYHYKSIIKAIFNRKIKLSDLRLLFLKKNIPLEMIPYRGAQWWAFNLKTLEKILFFYNENVDVLDCFYVKTFCPDENFFQTILMHLKSKYNDIEVQSSLTYDNWVKPGVIHPVTFVMEDIEELINQPKNKLFARKFDINLDATVLDELDKIS